MNFEAIYNILNDTLSQDDRIRDQSEIMLKKVSQMQGFLPYIMQVVSSDYLNLDLKLAAIIAVKSSIIRYWIKKDINNGYKISDQDKLLFIQNIIPFIKRNPEKSKIKIFGQGIRYISTVESGHFLKEILQALIFECSTSKEIECELILIIIYYIMQANVYSHDQKKESDIVEISLKILPILKALFIHAIKNIAENSSSICKIIVRIFVTILSIKAIQPLQDISDLPEWLNLFNLVLNTFTLPFYTNTFLNSWWSLQKWVFIALNRTFHFQRNITYERVIICRKTANTEATFIWINKFSIQFLMSSFNIIKHRGTEPECPKKVIKYLIQFITLCIYPSTTYTIIKENLDFILLDVILFYLRFDDDLQDMWTENPIELIQDLFDCNNILETNGSAATLLIELSKYRSTDIINVLINGLKTYLSEYESNKEHKDYAFEFAVLSSFGHIAPNIYDVPEFKEVIDFIFSKYIIPEFDSEYHPLRMEACWVTQKYCDYVFLDKSIDIQIKDKLISNIKFDNLPVKISAMIVMGSWYNREDLKYKRKEDIVDLVLMYLDFMNKYGINEIAVCLDAIIRTNEEVALENLPNMISSITEAFLKYSESDNDNELFAAIGYLTTIKNCCRIAESYPESLASIESIVLVPLSKYISSDGIICDYFENIIDILSIFVLNQESYSELIWSLFQKLIIVTKEKYESIEISAIIFIYFVINGSDGLLSRYIEKDGVKKVYMNALLETLIERFNCENTEKESIYCCYIIMAIILYYPCIIQSIIDFFFPIIVDTLSINKFKKKYRLVLIQLVCCCLFTNPRLSMKKLCNLNYYNDFIIKSIEYEAFLRFDSEKQLFLLSLTTLLSFSNQLPLDIYKSFYKFLISKLIDYHNSVENNNMGSNFVCENVPSETWAEDDEHNVYIDNFYNEDVVDDDFADYEDLDYNYIEEILSVITEESPLSFYYNFNKNSISINLEFSMALKECLSKEENEFVDLLIVKGNDLNWQ